MMLKTLFGKAGKFLLPLFLFFLPSCSSSPIIEWGYQETITCYPYFNSSRIFLSPTNPLREVEIEISRSGSGTEMYLNAYTFNFPYAEHNMRVSEVEIQIEEEKYCFEAELLIGGQRLVIPPHIATKITMALLNDQNVHIKSGRFNTTVSPEGFRKAVDRLKQIPIEFPSTS